VTVTNVASFPAKYPARRSRRARCPADRARLRRRDQSWHADQLVPRDAQRQI